MGLIVLKLKTEYFFCSPKLLKNVEEIEEIYKCINNIKWKEEFPLQ